MIYAKSGESHPNTSDEIFEQMLNRIIQLRLEPGQLISENQMSCGVRSVPLGHPALCLRVLSSLALLRFIRSGVPTSVSWI